MLFADAPVFQVRASGTSKQKSKTAAAEKMLTVLKGKKVVDSDEISW